MKSLALYNPEQMEQIQNFIYDTFGGEEDGLIAHEITSEYVHTDVQIVAPEGDSRVFVTFGMGAREMNAPYPVLGLRRVELLMCASKDLDIYSEEAMTIVNELVSLSKFPFENDTWLGPGHTVPASSRFCDTFGFDAFALDVIAASDFQDLGKVLFLAAIPIYKGERKTMMKRNTLDVLEQLEEEFGVGMYFADSYRMELKL